VSHPVDDDPSDLHRHHGHDHDDAQQDARAADASVRPARINDLAALGRVQEAVWRAAYRSVLSAEVLDRLDAAAFSRVWRQSLTTPPSERHRLLVACAGAQVVGLAAVGPSGDRDATQDAGELLVLGVHPDARRQGHGSRLLNAAIAAMQDAGVGRVRTWVLADHDDTRAFLVAAGMEPDGAHRARVVDGDGRTVSELRLTAELSPELTPETAAQIHLS